MHGETVKFTGLGSWETWNICCTHWESNRIRRSSIPVTLYRCSQSQADLLAETELRGPVTKYVNGELACQLFLTINTEMAVHC